MILIDSIEKKIKLAFAIAALSFLTAIILISVTFHHTRAVLAEERRQIYILDNNIPLVATKTNVLDNREAEYRAHISTFHNYFFSLPPDNDYIEQQMNRAMYLVDASGVAQYNTLKEKGYFTNLISSSSVVTCTLDSLSLDLNTRHWVFYGKQKIERPSMVTIRSLVTEGYLQDIPRTVNNSHGVLITHWKTIENRDILSNEKKLF
jgi:conjugative transposon TraK protein